MSIYWKKVKKWKVEKNMEVFLKQMKVFAHVSIKFEGKNEIWLI